MESRIQAFEILWSNRLQRPPLLTRTEEYDDPSTFLMPPPSWLVRTTADMVVSQPAEEVSVEAYWADVFGNNLDKTSEDNTVEQAVEDEDEMAVYWTEMFGDWGQEEEDWDPLDYDDDAGEVYDMLLLE
jgi:hypothetical protein